MPREFRRIRKPKYMMKSNKEEKTMKNRTENDVRDFNEAIAECKRPVWLVSSEGKTYNLKSAQEHDEAMVQWINDTNDEMEIFTCSYEDEAVMTHFWMQLHAA